MWERVNTPPIDSQKEYLEKVAKIIPGEIIVAYLAIIGFVPSIGKIGLHQFFYYIAFGIGLTGTAFYLNYQSEKGRPKFRHILMSCISFSLWAYSTTGDKVFKSFFDPAIASILLVAFSLISGKVSFNK